VDYLLPKDYKFGESIFDFNYGMVKFKWGNSKEESIAKVEIVDINGNIRTQIRIKAKDIEYNEKYKNNIECEIWFNSFYKSWKQYLEFYLKRPELILIYILGFSAISTLLGVILAWLFVPIQILKFIFNFLRWKTIPDEKLKRS